jgi:hypothetical protein
MLSGKHSGGFPYLFSEQKGDSWNEEFLKEKILYSWVLKIGFVQINLFFFFPFKLNTFIGFILESVTFEKCGIYIYMSW